MRKRSKRYKVSAQLVEVGKRYSLEEAVALISKMQRPKFEETVAVALKLGIDPKQSEQVVRGTVSLPHGSGKDVRVIVFAEGDKAEAAKASGAIEVGSADLAKKIGDGWLEFDVAIATPDMMKHVSKLGRVLGPRGLMPNPKTGTVTEDVAGAVRAFKAGRVEFKTDKLGHMNIPVGKTSFNEQALVENVVAALQAVVRAKPSGAKGAFLRRVALASTMNPAVRLDEAALTNRLS